MKRNLRPSHTNSFSRKALLPRRPSATKHRANIPPVVATTVSTAVVGAKGGTFCASGEISSAAAVKGEAGTMSRRLREASQQLSLQLSQQLSQVS
jgi:hypothetical protein